MSTEYKRQGEQTYESWLAIVVHSILLESGLRGVTVSKRLLQAFGKKDPLSSHCWQHVKGRSPRTRLLNT